MADLKTGTTIGGKMAWTQGNFPLYPAGNSLLYREYKIYTEYDKPDADNNDFVSKSRGGAYLGPIQFKNSDSANNNPEIIGNLPGIKLTNANHSLSISLDSAHLSFNIDNSEVIGWDNNTSTAKIFGNMRISDSSTGKYLDSDGNEMFGPQNKPTKTDVGLSNVIDERQVSATSTEPQKMAASLASPNFESLNGATQPSHLPRLDQVIEKNSTQDFGYYG